MSLGSHSSATTYSCIFKRSTWQTHWDIHVSLGIQEWRCPKTFALCWAFLGRLQSQDWLQGSLLRVAPATVLPWKLTLCAESNHIQQFYRKTCEHLIKWNLESNSILSKEVITIYLLQKSGVCFWSWKTTAPN